MVICKILERGKKVITVCCYIMTGNDSEVFSIERETGVIRTNRQLVSVVIIHCSHHLSSHWLKAYS